MLQGHYLLHFFKEFLFESCIFFYQQEVLFLEFICFFGLELKLLFIVIRLLNKKEFILIQIDTSLLFHNLLVYVFVRLFSKHQIVAHFFQDFAEGDKETSFDFFDIKIREFAEMLQSLLDGSIEFFEVFNQLLVSIWLCDEGRVMVLDEVLVVLLHGLLGVHLKGNEV